MTKKKDLAVKHLPVGTRIFLQKMDDRWHGVMLIGDDDHATADNAGLMGVIKQLAIRMLRMGAISVVAPEQVPLSGKDKDDGNG